MCPRVIESRMVAGAVLSPQETRSNRLVVGWVSRTRDRNSVAPIPALLELAQPPYADLSRALAHDAVVAPVALAQLARDPTPCLDLVVHHEQHGFTRRAGERSLSVHRR